jgi:hypothetical protein
MRFPNVLLCIFLSNLLLCHTGSSIPVAEADGVSIRHLTNAPGRPVRIAKDPRDGSLYLLLLNGDIHRLEVASGLGSSSVRLAHLAEEHGQHSAQGFAIAPNGTIYLVGNEVGGGQTVSTILRGTPSPDGESREWTVVARTDSYPRSNTAFDHVFNAVAVSPDGRHLFVNSGSRTDHGEVQSAGGNFPGMREVPLTARIFRLPADGENIPLVNDEAYLRVNGYVFAEGVRNAFSLSFDRHGNIFATENGPDRDNSDSLLWIREGHHYGFPWKIGGEDNPQRFPGYEPALDKLLNPKFTAVSSGYYHEDPSFPEPPAGVTFTDPVTNFGPHGVSYRDPGTGAIRDAAVEGRGLKSFTAHRSPLGLVFDTEGLLAEPFRHGGFVLGWTEGDPDGASVAGPFNDPGQDLLHLSLRRAGENYEMNSTRLVSGFSNPIDAEIVGNKLYVIEFGGAHGIWEISLPARLSLQLRGVEAGELVFTAMGETGTPLLIERSTDLLIWNPSRLIENATGTKEFREPVPEDGRAFFRARLQD